jgi:penicillin-binding protein 1C
VDLGAKVGAIGRWKAGPLACVALGLLAVAAAGGLALGILMGRLGPPPIERADAVSAIVLDRHDHLLRAFTTADGRWRLPVEIKDVDPRYLALLTAVEDKRFRDHPGVDPLALARAAFQLVRYRRVVSGGSTLTMQVARLLDGEHDRSFAGKLKQIARALQLERALGKHEILRIYLRLAPFGGNLEGVRAASLAYFGKEPRRLSIGEAALLVALPQAPEARRPDRFPEAGHRARDRVLARAVAGNVITAEEAARARLEPVPRSRQEFPKLAAHLAEAEAAREPADSVHRLTLDGAVQAQLETLAREHARALGQRLSAAILAVEHRTGEVIAHVGSADYFDGERLGAIDMVAAVRSPGSTLKPVIYGLAFEAGLAHAETLIEDRPARFGAYVPKNFDEDYRGTVTVREALAHSLNIPAVKVLNAVGPGKLLARLRSLELPAALPGASEPTLAIALGGLGLRLRDLAVVYAALARGGEVVDLTHRRTAGLPQGRPPVRLLEPAAAWYVTDVLKDAPPPADASGGRIAYKTGTSYGYRDAWAIGYDGHHTIAVWMGRADGGSTPGLTGRAAAAPILFDAFARLGAERAPLPPAPSGAARTAGSDLPPPLKHFPEPEDEASRSAYLEPPVRIAFPLDRSELERDAGESPLVLKAEGGALPLTWLVDGAPLPSEPHRREAAWQPEGAGFVRLSVIDGHGRADGVTVRLR